MIVSHGEHPEIHDRNPSRAAVVASPAIAAFPPAVAPSRRLPKLPSPNRSLPTVAAPTVAPTGIVAAPKGTPPPIASPMTSLAPCVDVPAGVCTSTLATPPAIAPLTPPLGATNPTVPPTTAPPIARGAIASICPVESANVAPATAPPTAPETAFKLRQTHLLGSSCRSPSTTTSSSGCSSSLLGSGV